MPKLDATQHKPADTPAPSPSPSEGRGPKNIPNTRAAIRHSTKVEPKISAMLAVLSCSSVTPDSRCHARANSKGEYHRPPSIKLATAAARTARKLISGIVVLLLWR